MTAPTRPGFLTAWASGAMRPATSNLNFAAGQTGANTVIAPVGANGSINLYNGSGGTTQVIADITAYISAN